MTKILGFRPYFPQAIFLLLMLIPASVEAHAKLVSAEPAVNSSGATPTAIKLHFDDPLETQFSSLRLTDMHGTPVTTVSASTKDAQTLTATLTATLASGRYTVSWTAVSTEDGHKTMGTYSFTVK